MSPENKNKLAFDSLILYGFCAAVFFTPISISTSTAFAYMAIALSIFGGRFFRDAGQWPKKEWFIPVMIFIVLHWVGLIYTEDFGLGIKFAKKTHYWLSAFAVMALASRGLPLRAIVNSFIAGMSLTAAIHIMQYAGVLPLYKRAGAIGFIHHITYSLMAVFAIMVLSNYFGKEADKRKRFLIGLLSVLLFASLVVGIGRTGYLVLVVLSPVIIMNFAGRNNVLKVGVIVVLCLGAMFISPSVRERTKTAITDIKSYREGVIETSVGLRFYMWGGALKTIKEHPLFGVGTGGYILELEKQDKNLYESLKDKISNQPHNTYLYMAVSFGVPGLAALLWLFAALVRTGWRNRNSVLGFSLFSYTLVMMVGSLTDTQIIQGQSAMLLAILTGAGDQPGEPREDDPGAQRVR